jgi:hypothetical protein
MTTTCLNRRHLRATKGCWRSGAVARDRSRHPRLVRQAGLEGCASYQARASIGHSLPKVPRQFSCEWRDEHRWCSKHRVPLAWWPPMLLHIRKGASPRLVPTEPSAVTKASVPILPAARHADDAIVDFDYAGNFPGCLFGFGTHGSVATRACKSHFAICDRYRDAIGCHNKADVLRER